MAQQLHANGIKSDDAFNNGHAAGVASVFTEDAVVVTDQGPVYGRQAIIKVDQISPHMIGTTDKAWNNGEWSTTVQGQNGAPIEMKGYWSSITVHEGNTWKDQLQTWNITPAPAATPSPKASPSNQ